MTTPRRGLLFHFTHLANLESVAATGLVADSQVRLDGRLETEVGNEAIKAPRRRRPVPCGPCGTVGDYVPFYFAARSPMLGSIHQGRVATYQGGQQDLVYLVSHVDRVRELDLPYVISDRNAVKAYAAFSDDLADLDAMVDWELMEGRMWNNTPDEPDRMERRMAELLVHREVPWAAFLGVATFDEARADRVRRTLAKVGRSAKVEVRKGWYF